MPTITCVDDFRRLYARRVPKMFRDYAESGSYTETTLSRNERDLQDVTIRQRVGTDVSNVSTTTTLLGEKTSLPVAFAPIGMLGIQHASGEILVAKAAESAGVPFILSTMSICSIEQVATERRSPFWYQLYVVKDREFVRDCIQRAKAAGCSQLVVTMDLPVLGQRHRDVRNGLSIRPKLRHLADFASKPSWAARMAMTPYKTFGNVIGHAKSVDSLDSLLVWAAEQVDPTLSWSDVEWIQSEWGKPVVIKGILDPDDARIASDLGTAAVIVSNHGGRQLDGAASTISVLSRVVDAVGDRTEVIMDSGVRTGMDIFRARALGASGVLLGRAMVYALGAMGEKGVSTLLTLLEKELRVTMALAGRTDVSAIERTDVGVPTTWR